MSKSATFYAGCAEESGSSARTVGTLPLGWNQSRLMHDLNVRDSFTTDQHFRLDGFNPLLGKPI